VAKDTAAATRSAAVTRLQLSQTRDARPQTLQSIQPTPAAPLLSQRPITHLSARRNATVAAALQHREPAALRSVHQLQCQLHGPGVGPGHGHGLGQPLVLTRPPDRLASLHLQQPALLTRRHSVLLLKPQAHRHRRPQAHRHLKPQALLLKPPAHRHLKPQALLTRRHSALHLHFLPPVSLTQHQPQVHRQFLLQAPASRAHLAAHACARDTSTPAVRRTAAVTMSALASRRRRSRLLPARVLTRIPLQGITNLRVGD
jgi:hypothetical protein